MPQKFFTEPAFNQAKSCLAGMYYSRNPQLYANQGQENDALVRTQEFRKR